MTKNQDDGGEVARDDELFVLLQQKGQYNK